MLSKSHLYQGFIMIVFFILAVLIWFFSRPNTENPRTDLILNKNFVVFNEKKERIDYKQQYLSDGSIDTLHEEIFSSLDKTLRNIEENLVVYEEGNVIYTANLATRGAFAVFKFSKNKTVYLTAYVESPLFGLPFVNSKFIDVDNDGNEDIFLISHSGNYLNIERLWFFLYRNGAYELASPLTPIEVDISKALTGEIPAQNAMEIRTHAGVFSIWLKDIDSDGMLEVVTLDRGSFTETEEDNQLTKQVYKLKDNSFVLEQESTLERNSEEYRKIKSWSMFPQ